MIQLLPKFMVKKNTFQRKISVLKSKGKQISVCALHKKANLTLCIITLPKDASFQWMICTKKMVVAVWLCFQKLFFNFKTRNSREEHLWKPSIILLITSKPHDMISLNGCCTSSNVF